MTCEEAFHESILNYGGRFDTSTLLPDDTRALFEDHAFRFRKYLEAWKATYPKNSPLIHFDWVKNDEVNAYAFNGAKVKLNDWYFIGITKGAIIYLHILFERMLACKQFFPTIGIPDGEMDFNPIPDLIPHLASLETPGIEWVLPKDPIRKVFSEFLIRMIADFLFYHELSHVLDGHVGFINRGGRPVRFELCATRRTKKKKDYRSHHMMEILADSYAMTAGLAELMAICDQPYLIGTSLSQFYNNRYDALRHWSFVVSFYFRLCANGITSSPDVYDEDHPPPIMRQARVCQHGAAAIREYWPAVDIEKARKSLIEGCAAADHAIAYLMGLSEVKVDAINKAFQDLPQYDTDNVAHWENELKPKMVKHSFRALPNIRLDR